MSATKKRRNLVAFVVIMCLVVLGALSIYYQFMKKQQMQETVHTPTTETEKLIAKDLQVGYPETPKEVMKLFSRYNQCIYNKTLSEEEFSALVSQLRILYCEDLQKQNGLEKMEREISDDIEEYKKTDKKIVSYTIDEESNYQYKTIDNREMVYLKYSYFMREGDKYSTWNQWAILVKESEKWKILGFGSAPAKDNDVVIKN